MSTKQMALRPRQVLRWIIGKREVREWKGFDGPKEILMEATPWGWESAGPPYHTMPAPSPMLVPRPLRPVWALFYYLPIMAKRRFKRSRLR